VKPIRAAAIGLVVGALAAAGVLSLVNRNDQSVDTSTARLASPDTPPAEFAYLDSARVLAYLGQIEGGLAATQTRTLSSTSSEKAGLSAHDIASAEAAVEQSRASSETVTLNEADRFYTLLRILRADQGSNGERAFGKLRDIDATVGSGRGADAARRELAGIHEGDFVRIDNAHVFIPPYAGVLPRARFASYYLHGDLNPPARPLYAPVRKSGQAAVRRYRGALGRNPRIPLVVPTLDAEQQPAPDGVTFFLPARYYSLSQEASELSGSVTVVGKLLYKDPRLAANVKPEDPVAPTYFDRETLTEFTPALQRADPLLLQRMNLVRDRLIREVNRSLTISAPLAVVLPLAIYQ